MIASKRLIRTGSVRYNRITVAKLQYRIVVYIQKWHTLIKTKLPFSLFVPDRAAPHQVINIPYGIFVILRTADRLLSTSRGNLSIRVRGCLANHFQIAPFFMPCGPKNTYLQEIVWLKLGSFGLVFLRSPAILPGFFSPRQVGIASHDFVLRLDKRLEINLF